MSITKPLGLLQGLCCVWVNLGFGWPGGSKRNLRGAAGFADIGGLLHNQLLTSGRQHSRNCEGLYAGGERKPGEPRLIHTNLFALEALPEILSGKTAEERRKIALRCDSSVFLDFEKFLFVIAPC
jgi:hypothetical protein